MDHGQHFRHHFEHPPRYLETYLHISYSVAQKEKCAHGDVSHVESTVFWTLAQGVQVKKAADSFVFSGVM